MRTIALNQALLRATSATLALALFVSPAGAQVGVLAPNAPNDGAAPNNAATAAAANPAATPSAAPAAPPRIIQHIAVAGTQRVEPDTVLTYIGEREGDPYDPATNDAAIKTLTASGLFSDVKTAFDPATGTLTVRVVENPIVNTVIFSGNKKIKSNILAGVVQTDARGVLTDAKLQSDVQRIKDYYTVQGRSTADVQSEVTKLPNDRVDVLMVTADHSGHPLTTTAVASVPAGPGPGGQRSWWLPSTAAAPMG